jgi:hypothetical protein
MGRVGCALDNAIPESFVATLKTELASRSRFAAGTGSRRHAPDCLLGRARGRQAPVCRRCRHDTPSGDEVDRHRRDPGPPV